MRTRFLLFLLSSLFFYACDSTKEKTNGYKVVGTWDATVTKTTENGIMSGDISTKFGADRTFYQKGSASISGVPINFTASGTWSVEGKYLVMTLKKSSLGDIAPENMTSTSEILELSTTKMILDEEELGRVVYTKK